MRFNTLRFLVREGVRGLSKNWFMSIASVLVLVSCLLITGCAYLVLENIDHGMQWAYQQNVVAVYAEAGQTDEQLKALEDSLKAVPNVVEVEFKSNEQQLEEYRDEYGALFEDLENDNPLLDAYFVHFEDLTLFNQSVTTIAQLEGIDSVDYDKSMAEMTVKIRTVVVTVGGWVIGLLLVVSLFIISNTIKLTVYSRRREIFIMRSVGATQWFIRFPFMVEGVILGGLAGSVAYGLVVALYQALGASGLLDFGSSFSLIPFSMVWWQLLVGFLAGGIITGVLGSVISISRYLKEQSDKVFET
ncbi:MAG: permease-like cell division protein FtsX [Clostridia bacterium]|nr:permease-like cell division protein FtsX [Clostridia bacterium]